MEDSVQLLSTYGSWATARVLVSLDQISFDDYTGPVCSGHGSIRATLIHVMDAERGWIRWLAGEATMRDARNDRLTEQEHPTLADAKRLWTGIDEATRRYVATLDEAALAETRSIPAPGGTACEIAVRDLLLHVFSHGTHTRAQIAAAIRRSGFEPQPLDLIRYLLGR